MSFIFKSVIKLESLRNFSKETISHTKRNTEKCVAFVKKHGAAFRISTFAFVSALAIFVSFTFAGARVVYKVNYKGKSIATVERKEDVDSAVSEVVGIVSGKGVEQAVETPEVVPVVAVNAATDGQKAVVNAIIENTDEIVEGAELLVDGQQVLCGNDRTILKVMDEYLESFDLPEGESQSRFVQTLSLKKGYFCEKDVKGEQEIKKFIKMLAVETVAKVTEYTDVPFGTTIEKNYEKPYGYTETIFAGQNGKNCIVKNIRYINGVPCSEEILSDNQLIAPQNEIKLLGQKVQVLVAPTAEAGEMLESGFIFPLPKGVWQVSAYFGDNRGHKGIDLRAPAGTPIMAAAGGKVCFAGWKNGYGNCIEIDHGNGIHTLYGHASALYISDQQYVEAGDVIAAVGCTGNSTGNHLHFEVISGGSRINPAPYLGIN